MGKSKIFKYVPLIIALCGVIMLIAAFFLPYAAADSEYKEWLVDHADGMYAEEIGMTNSDAIGISPFEFLRIYIYGASNYSGSNQTISVICIVMIGLIAGFTLLCTLFAALRKPIPLIVFDILTLAVLLLMNYDFESRGVISNGRYDWGIASYLYFIGFTVTFVGAVWLLIIKIKAKKSSKMTQEEI
ncbi:MAG: hypothetical protein K2J11_01590 [Oscillospiraceae bacterium]|nr:hypothetical protein [Oscillospiraceae bacterium]